MKGKCENCNLNHDGEYGSGRFCNNKCARGFSTKAKRKEINEKVSKSLTRDDSLHSRVCTYCNVEYKAYLNKNVKFCSVSCSAKFNWSNEEYREDMTKKIRKRCGTDEGRKRLRDIGRLGGFGTRCVTNGGVKCDSMFEKKCFELIEDLNIEFIPHKNIPNSSKVSDVYLVKDDLWIELDGIDREKRKKWLGENYTYWLNKLEIYEKEGLDLIIIKSLKELKEYFNVK